MTRKPRLLFVGDQCGPTGFSTVAHSILAQLVKAWDVAAVGIGYKGDPHPWPWRIYPAQPRNQGSMHGFDRYSELLEFERPDVLFVNSDLYVVAQYLHLNSLPMKDKKGKPITPPKVVAYTPIDSRGPSHRIVGALKGLDLFVSYTDFGVTEIRKAGFEGPAIVIPHGIDQALFSPRDRNEARSLLSGTKLGPDTLVIGNVNRNQPRKRLDLTVMYFAEWVKRGGDGHLVLHCARQDAGWDLLEMAMQCGVGKNVTVASAQRLDDLPDPSLLPFIYSALDIQVSTTLGEGWGLTTMEGMACGVPQVVPDWSALGEWTKPAASLVRCSEMQALDGYWNFGFGGVVDREGFIAALDEMASSADLRADCSRLGLELVSRPEYRWENIAQRFHEALIDVAFGERREVAA